MPQILKVDTSDPDLWDNIIKKTQKVLKGGGVIAFPTDTFYGLGADPYNKDAVNKIYEIKNKKNDKNMLHKRTSGVSSSTHGEVVQRTKDVQEEDD